MDIALDAIEGAISIFVGVGVLYLTWLRFKSGPIDVNAAVKQHAPPGPYAVQIDDKPPAPDL